jgi:hypothetical protein
LKDQSIQGQISAGSGFVNLGYHLSKTVDPKIGGSRTGVEPFVESEINRFGTGS